jgi:mono/diheme cytochrome c family protein
MYTGFLHTHKLVVLLFLLLYVVKTALLLLNQKESLTKITKFTKIPEMILSTLFLVTGGYMLFNKPEIHYFTWIKVVAVFASIPLAVVGFKKSNKVLAALSLVLLVAAYGLAEMAKKQVAKKEIVVEAPAGSTIDAVTQGKAVFKAYCVNCHGEDGKLMVAGAKDLSVSQLSDEEVKNIILNGKNAMAPYKNVLAEPELNNVVEYVKSLRR